MQIPGDQTAFHSVARAASYDEWRGVNRLDEELLAWNYFLTPNSLPDWEPERIDSVSSPQWPRSIQSVWACGTHMLALFDVFECASRLEAHSLLVSLLANVESPLVARDAEPAYGDVTFRQGGALTLFARANLVFFLRAAERAEVPIADAAAHLDGELISKPEEPPKAEGAPMIRAFRAETAEVARGQSVSLDLSVEDPTNRPLWYKCFSPSGELSLSEGRPVYRHESDGPPEVTLYAVVPGRGAARQTLY